MFLSIQIQKLQKLQVNHRIAYRVSFEEIGNEKPHVTVFYRALAKLL